MRFDFPTLLVALVALCGVIWLLDVWVLAPRRRLATQVHLDETGQAVQHEPPMPRVVEYARSFLPVFVVVLVLRSFLVEPFRIPSGSMMPTLLIGDYILVNKYDYGIRLPVLDTKIIDLGSPRRGDVVVFRYPRDPSTPFIKRVVGLPGDRIAYRDKALYVNGEVVPRTRVGSYVGSGGGSRFTGADEFRETLDGREHAILVTPRILGGREGEWLVPEGHYFVLGDNRDNSEDSRYWRFVPDENLIGRAFLIWMSWDGGPRWGRIGDSIE